MLQAFLLAMIRWRVVVLGAAILWAVLGTWIVWNIPIDALPDLSDNQVLVYSPWINHDPPEIESEITQPLSRALKDIPGLQTIRGSSDVGFSLIHCIFDERIPFQEARKRVETVLRSDPVKLPQGVQSQLAPEGIPTGQIVWYTVSGSGIDLVELRSWQEEFIAPRLSMLDGVAEVASVGGMKAEIQWRVDPTAVAELGLSIGQLQSQLQQIPPSLLDTQPADLEKQLSLLRELPLEMPDGSRIPLESLGPVTIQPTARQGVFEQDGSESVAGIVHLKAGSNPLQVTQRVLDQLLSIGRELPDHLRLMPCYDRTRLIQGSVQTLSQTLIEAMIVTTLGIWIIMRHLRTSLVIVLTVPLSVLGALVGMTVLNRTGVAMNANIMSLAGIAISIGVLVDSSIVVVDNIMHQLRKRFGDQPVTGDTSLIVAEATALVAKPAVFAILIMLVSFLPIFCLEGIDGKMYRPLAWTKTLTLFSILILAITVVPALASFLIRGRMRSETDNPIVRTVSEVYRPCLRYLLSHPLPLVVMLACVVIAAASMIGVPWASRWVCAIAIGCVWLASQRWWVGGACTGFVLIFALIVQLYVKPISLAMRLPLDEGMVMDMPITIPRMNPAQASDDLKARNMILCRFPEVQMVSGKAGRADTAFDPAPMDMIETMIEFRPRDRWPRRRLLRSDAMHHARYVLREMSLAGLIEPIPQAEEEMRLDEIVSAGLDHFNAMQREVCWHEWKRYEKKLADELCFIAAQEVNKTWVRSHLIHAPLSELELRGLVSKLDVQDRLRVASQPTSHSIEIVLRQLTQLAQRQSLFESQVRKIENPPSLSAQLQTQLQSLSQRRWREFLSEVNQSLYARVGRTWTQIVVNELCARSVLVDSSFADVWDQILAARHSRSASTHHGTGHTGMPSYSQLPIIDPHPKYDALMKKCSERLAARVWLWPHDSESLAGASGELDAAVQMPGWANVWTRPIQNRIDMLATGVNSELGVRVLGSDFRTVVDASEKIAEILQQIPGAANVLCDPVRDKDYVDITLNHSLIEAQGFNRDEVQLAMDAVLRGKLMDASSKDALTTTPAMPVRLAIVSKSPGGSILDIAIPLQSQKSNDYGKPTVENQWLRDLCSLQHSDGPATIKSENGRLRNYVRLNVRDRSVDDWLREAKQTLSNASLPEGISLEWTGQFEHAAKTRSAMQWIIPLCVLIIGCLLYFVFRDVADSLLMLLSVPGALAGAVVCQWLLGFPFSLAVGVGYIACFGMAAATSMVMLVYLRQSLADAGGLESLTLDQLKSTVIEGAVQRLRPKLLTEATMILGLAPMMWSQGTGADVIRPMAAPVLGGILIADEVVDLLIPLLFYSLRKRRWLRIHQVSSKVKS